MGKNLKTEFCPVDENTLVHHAMIPKSTPWAVKSTDPRTPGDRSTRKSLIVDCSSFFVSECGADTDVYNIHETEIKLSNFHSDE